MAIGCGTFVICFFATALLCIPASGTDAIGLVLILGTIAMFVLPFVVGNHYSQKQREEQKQYNLSHLASDIESSDKTITLAYNNNKGVCTYILNASKHRIDYIDNEGKKSIDINHVIDCNIVKDSEVVQSTSSDKTMMGAFVAGVPGAIIGRAMSTPPQVKTELKDFYVRFILDNPLEPIQNIVFIGSGILGSHHEAQEIAENIFAFTVACMKELGK